MPWYPGAHLRTLASSLFGNFLRLLTLPLLPAPLLAVSGSFWYFCQWCGEQGPWEFTKRVVGLGVSRAGGCLSGNGVLPPTQSLSMACLSVTEKFRDRCNILNRNPCQAFGWLSWLEIEANHFRGFALACSMDSQPKADVQLTPAQIKGNTPPWIFKKGAWRWVRQHWCHTRQWAKSKKQLSSNSSWEGWES